MWKWITRLLLLAAVFAATPSQAQTAPEEFIFAQRGTLPIILTAPHGGQLRIPGVRSRQEECNKSHYDYVLCGRDEYTEEITTRLMNRLEELLGRKPHAVIAKFHREFIDANRRQSNAFISPEAKPYYNAYHNRIRAFVDEVRMKYSDRGVLLDIHGCCRQPRGLEDPDSIYRGTGEGVSVTRLLRQHGLKALTGPRSIFGKLKDAGYSVVPALTEPANAERILQGGYTVYAYGSHTSNGIDTIQVELGWNLRKDPSRRERLVDDLAHAIAVFYKEYVR